ncbi:MAG: tRNA guanosine(34) transglycosylase Tgt [Puniceicoccales bacterium]|jgi:queuine tRNA-ribosyltransferase|nr:tRNA guanosine(34) transglycosylase Tgt [Puniceicoccales bacterium]
MERELFGFEITHGDPSGARCGLLRTPHGVVETPNFIFCATKGTIKGLTMDQMRAAGAQMILSNTYHLHLQPGEEVVESIGGLHRMMDWKGPILTDSGGFQIFSLGHGATACEIKGKRGLMGNQSLIKIEESGALFRSHLDGSHRLLTPEKSIQIQRTLGADIILTLDECTPDHADRRYVELSTQRSHRWEQRSLDEFLKNDDGSQALYGIIQGSTYENLRRESCDFVSNRAFFGQAVGGSLGVNAEQMRQIIALVGQMKNSIRPTHLLGIGTVEAILHGVQCAMDTFDCVHPTRLARHGGALVFRDRGDGKFCLNLKNARFQRDRDPIDENCSCYACSRASRGYIHHLLKAKEQLGGQLLTIHNVAFMCRLMGKIRCAIRGKSFRALLSELLA